MTKPGSDVTPGDNPVGGSGKLSQVGVSHRLERLESKKRNTCSGKKTRPKSSGSVQRANHSIRSTCSCESQVIKDSDYSGPSCGTSLAITHKLKLKGFLPFGDISAPDFKIPTSFNFTLKVPTLLNRQSSSFTFAKRADAEVSASPQT